MRQSKDHAILSDLYGSQMTNRFSSLVDDMHRIYRKVGHFLDEYINANFVGILRKQRKTYFFFVKCTRFHIGAARCVLFHVI